MKIFRRDEFLELPEGTVYCKGKEWWFQGLEFKHERAGKNDWYAASPNWVEGSGTEECLDRLEEMLETGASYPMQTSICRDGLFDDDAIFLVLEKADLLELRDWVDAALAVAE